MVFVSTLDEFGVLGFLDPLTIFRIQSFITELECAQHRITPIAQL
jgi:hypothetical protein